MRILTLLFKYRVGRFSTTGTACNVLIYAPLFYLLSGYGDTTASLIGFSISSIAAFVLQKYWTFRDRSEEAIRYQLPIYTAIRIASVPLNTIALNYMLQYVYPDRYVAWAVVLFVLGIPSYVISNLIFKERPASAIPSKPFTQVG